MLQEPSGAEGAAGDRPEGWKAVGQQGDPLLLDRESVMSWGTVCSGLLMASRLLCDRLWCSTWEVAIS